MQLGAARTKIRPTRHSRRLLGGTDPVQPGEPRAQAPRLGSSRQVTYPAALGGL